MRRTAVIVAVVAVLTLAVLCGCGNAGEEYRLSMSSLCDEYAELTTEAQEILGIKVGELDRNDVRGMEKIADNIDELTGQLEKLKAPDDMKAAHKLALKGFEYGCDSVKYAASGMEKFIDGDIFAGGDDMTKSGEFADKSSEYMEEALDLLPEQ